MSRRDDWRSAHPLSTLGMAAALVLAALTVPAPAAAELTEGTALLPDLAMLQPDDFRLERKPGGVRWLRFATTIVNIGEGRFDVYGSERDPEDSTKLTKVTQRIQDGAGGWDEHATAATMFYAGDGHDHWHVYGLQEWILAFEATPNEKVRGGAKTGFCFWDNVELWEAPSYYTSTNSCHMKADATVPMGLSVGWGDRYPATIAYQYIDISGLPYGNYCLTLIADPNGEFVEAQTGNNTVSALISIQTGGVTVLATSCGESTEPPSGGTVHVADLDGSVNVKGQSGRWEAIVSAQVIDQDANPVSGATVVGDWGGDTTGTSSGTTGSDGWVTLSSGNISGGGQVTFTVRSVSADGMSYDDSLNTDPDAEDGSDGTVIVITKP